MYIVASGQSDGTVVYNSLKPLLALMSYAAMQCKHEKVYELDLHGKKIARIENLEKVCNDSCTKSVCEVT